MKVGDLVKYRSGPGWNPSWNGRGNIGIITSVLEDKDAHGHCWVQFLVYWFNAKWGDVAVRTRETEETLRWVGKKIEKNSQVSGFSTLTFVDAQTIITV